MWYKEKMEKQVTEADFRKPEFLHAETRDYEFSGDGKVVRKDRWKTAIMAIRDIVGINDRSFEIADVVNKVALLQTLASGTHWRVGKDVPDCRTIDIMMIEDNIVHIGVYFHVYHGWRYSNNDAVLTPQGEIAAWRLHSSTEDGQPTSI